MSALSTIAPTLPSSPSNRLPRHRLVCGIIPHPLEKEDLSQFYILVTRRCNMNCPYCIESQVNTGGFMSEEDFIHSLNLAKQLKMKTVYLHGGEPTIHLDIVHYAQLAKNFGFYVNMFTNGLREDVLRKLDGIVDEIRFSYEPGRDYMFHAQSEWKSRIKLYIMATIKSYPTESNLMDVINRALSLEMGVKVRTLNPVNPYAYENQFVPYLHNRILEIPVDKLFCDGNKIAFKMENGVVVRLGNLQLNPGHLKFSVTPDGKLQDHFNHSDKKSIIPDPKIESMLQQFEPLRQWMLNL